MSIHTHTHTHTHALNALMPLSILTHLLAHSPTHPPTHSHTNAPGFPCTAALARTQLNVLKGATSRAAGVINAATVFVIVTFLNDTFRYLPLPLVASMMLSITSTMPDWQLLREWWAVGNYGALGTMAIVAVTCVLVDPGMGLVVGVAVDSYRRTTPNPPKFLAVPEPLGDVAASHGSSPRASRDVPPGSNSALQPWRWRANAPGASATTIQHM
jgi:hypothetical protein